MPASVFGGPIFRYLLKDHSNDTVTTLEIGRWSPTSGTANGKASIVLLEHGSYGNFDPVNSAHSGLLCTELCEAGYDSYMVEMPFDGDVTTHDASPDPNGTINYLKFFTDGAIIVLNKIINDGKTGGYLHRFSMNCDLNEAGADHQGLSPRSGTRVRQYSFQERSSGLPRFPAHRRKPRMRG